ncbi:hypothetical protein ACS0TY_022783 [Phlomoides rotata]
MDDEVELQAVLVAIFGLIIELMNEVNSFVVFMSFGYLFLRRRTIQSRRLQGNYSLRSKVTRQLDRLHFLINYNDETCKDHIRMNSDCFNRLCFLLQNLGGLSSTRNVSISEQVAIFLTVLSHHTKNRVVKHSFDRSGYTISKHFNGVLNTLLRLHRVLLAKPVHVPDDSTDYRWKYFKGCLGALDGTYIPVRVPHSDIPRYRNRKGNVSVNVLAVCDQNMNFVYVLSGWEGSAADSRILRDAVTRPHGFKVPNGSYYLCDDGYTNGNGFLAPYRGVRYHLKEWDDSRQPQNYQEYYNLKHAKARNCIERSFGILKARWGILRSNSYYPIKTQNRFILDCCLLHNFIRTHMDVDPYEDDVPESYSDVNEGNGGTEGYIDQVESSQEWTSWRDNLAIQMFVDYDRRVWTYMEEKELVCALKELVVKGHKCDNGFRSGYLNLLENSIASKFPGTDLKGDPHINSKIHVWKKQYACLKLMLGVSGIGLNSTTFRIDALPEVWAAYIKVDSAARGLQKKTFPFYADWTEIFGNDRATGADSQAYVDAEQDVLNRTSKNADNSVGGDKSFEVPAANDQSTAEFSTFNVGESSSATKDKSKGLKRK